ncbi:MAG: VWA domain-containing protein [Thermoguttaceae bacterium]
MSFRFHSPWWLLLIALVVVLVVWRRRAVPSVLFSDVGLVRQLPHTAVQRLAPYLPILLYASLVCAIVALARPQQGREEFRTRSEGIAIIMAVDRSGSMRAIDFEIAGENVTRLEAVKKTFRDFSLGTGKLHGRPDDQIGLVAFGGYVDAVCPPTLDHQALVNTLDAVTIFEPVVSDNGQILFADNYREENATAIGDAIADAAQRLQEVKAKSRVVIFLSDGEQTTGVLTPEEGARVAKELGVKVYTIGIGSTGPAPFAARDRRGNTVYQMQHVVLDEKTLAMIAKETGGEYLAARDTDALERVYATIDKLEKTEHEGVRFTRYRELYRQPLLAAVALLLVYVALRTTRLRSLPMEL